MGKGEGLKERKGIFVKGLYQRTAVVALAGVLLVCAGCYGAGGAEDDSSRTGAGSSSFVAESAPSLGEAVSSSIAEEGSTAPEPEQPDPVWKIWDRDLLKEQTIVQIANGNSMLLSGKGEVYVATELVHLFGLEGAGATRVMRLRLEESAKLVGGDWERYFAVGKSNTIYYWGHPL